MEFLVSLALLIAVPSFLTLLVAVLFCRIEVRKYRAVHGLAASPKGLPMWVCFCLAAVAAVVGIGLWLSWSGWPPVFMESLSNVPREFSWVQILGLALTIVGAVVVITWSARWPVTSALVAAMGAGVGAASVYWTLAVASSDPQAGVGVLLAIVCVPLALLPVSLVAGIGSAKRRRRRTRALSACPGELIH